MEKKYWKTQKGIWFCGIGAVAKNITAKIEKIINWLLCGGLRNTTSISKTKTTNIPKWRKTIINSKAWITHLEQ